MNYLKNKLKRDKDVPATEQFYTPLRIALHSTIKLNVVDILTVTGLSPLFVVPKGDLEVLAIGNFDMHGVNVFQIYCSDDSQEEFILQVIQGKDYRTNDPKVDEISLFKQVYTEQPETQTSMDRILGQIGFTSLQLEGITYDRLWGDRFTEKRDFDTFHEKVVTPNGTDNFVNNYILYGRDIEDVTGDKLQELLLVGLEEDNDRRQVMMQLGLKLDVNTVSVQ